MQKTVFRMKYRIEADDPRFEGHFPGASIFPGVGQIDLILDALRRHHEGPVQSSCVKRAKFRALLLPGSEVEMELTLLGEGEARWTLEANAQIVSNGEISYVRA